jgi:hypothetical protein
MAARRTPSSGVPSWHTVIRESAKLKAASLQLLVQLVEDDVAEQGT